MASTQGSCILKLPTYSATILPPQGVKISHTRGPQQDVNVALASWSVPFGCAHLPTAAAIVSIQIQCLKHGFHNHTALAYREKEGSKPGICLEHALTELLHQQVKPLDTYIPKGKLYPSNLYGVLHLTILLIDHSFFWIVTCTVHLYDTVQYGAWSANLESISSYPYLSAMELHNWSIEKYSGPPLMWPPIFCQAETVI